MRERLLLFVRLLLFWLLYMLVIRVIFLSYNHDLSSQLSITEILLTILHGLRMDGSMIGYYLAASGLLITFSALTPGRWFFITLTTLTFILLVFSGMVVIVDMELYRHWGFRMNNTPFMYMGSGAMGSINPMVAVKTLTILILLTTAFILLYNRWIASAVHQLKACNKKASLIIFIATALMFLPIRGSFTVAPMNTGFVYFHKSKAYANHAAINVIWNFLYSLRKTSGASYPETFFDKEKTQQLVSTLYPPTDSTIQIFKTRQPNIILLIVESFTSDVIEPLGGKPGIAPQLSALCKEGILFTNFFASGDRTDKGIIAILSGYPAQPQTSIIKFPAKTQRLPFLNRHLKALGYKTSFTYGGDVDFANFRSYLTTAGFDQLTTMDDFPDEFNVSKWGVHDQFLFDQVKAELDTTTAPFFKTILTLSSHEPFDVPMEIVIKGKDDESMFLNSCYYTDKCIGDFVTYCKKQSWWENTVLIITADHGHRHPNKKELKDERRFRIPLLMLGGAIKKDTVITTIGNQTDIANTLLAQFQRESEEFNFSKNMFSTNVVPFAAYFFNDGYGFVLPGKHIVYDNPGQILLTKTNATEEDIDLSKAYQQKLYSDYNKR